MRFRGFIVPTNYQVSTNYESDTNIRITLYTTPPPFEHLPFEKGEETIYIPHP